MQAALGLAQLEKLECFITARKQNFVRLTALLSKYQNQLILPEASEHSNPSWFGYLITLREDASISRNELIHELTQRKIDTRLFFAGDLRKQPYFKHLSYREIGKLSTTEMVLRQTFWIGVGPLLTNEMIDYVGRSFDEILTSVSPN